MSIFKKNKDTTLTKTVVSTEKNTISDNTAAVKQLAKYQQKQVQSVLEEDYKLTQDIKKIHAEFDSVTGNMNTLDTSISNFKNNFHDLMDTVNQYREYQSRVHNSIQTAQNRVANFTQE